VSSRNRASVRSHLDKAARADVRAVARGGAVQITGQLMQGGLSFLFVAIAVRILGTADYGLFRQAVQALAITGQLGLVGFNYSAMRFIARSRARGNPAGVRSSPQAMTSQLHSCPTASGAPSTAASSTAAGNPYRGSRISA
jgi:hypothetical protein